MNVKHYIAYSVVIVLFIILSRLNVGVLNDDTSLGFFIAWVVYFVLGLYSNLFSKKEK